MAFEPIAIDRIMRGIVHKWDGIPVTTVVATIAQAMTTA